MSNQTRGKSRKALKRRALRAEARFCFQWEKETLRCYIVGHFGKYDIRKLNNNERQTMALRALDWLDSQNFEELSRGRLTYIVESIYNVILKSERHERGQRYFQHCDRS